MPEADLTDTLDGPLPQQREVHSFVLDRVKLLKDLLCISSHMQLCRSETACVESNPRPQTDGLRDNPSRWIDSFHFIRRILDRRRRLTTGPGLLVLFVYVVCSAATSTITLLQAIGD